MTVTDGRALAAVHPRRLLEALQAERDPMGLCAFRALFGAVATFAVIRFWSYGWIEELYLQPAFHFTYFGFEWVKPWPGWGMYAHFALMAAAAFGLCIGFASRVSALIFLLTFTYAELIEKASYLNHYYFVSLISLLLALMPSGASLSIDAWRRRRLARPPPSVRRWCYALLRAQLAIVYFFAGFAKLNADWLLSAQPLETWLGLHADAPWVGGLLAQSWVAYVASYAGAFYDLTIVLWLSWRRTRPYAFVAVTLFHVCVWLLFPIGVFSWFMVAAATVFFDPAWPRRWLRAHATRSFSASDDGSGRLGVLRAAGVGLYLALQIAVPLRYLLYPGSVNWHEQGFRFAWRVMLIEKAGRVEFDVVTGPDERHYPVYPREELTPWQYKMMSTQPDMIHEYAHHLERRFAQSGHGQVRVHANAWAALNGRPSQRLIDPTVDLGSEPRSLWPKRWIVPLETGRAPRPGGRAARRPRR